MFKELGKKKRRKKSALLWVFFSWLEHPPPPIGRQVFFKDALLEVLEEDDDNSQGFQVNRGQKSTSRHSVLLSEMASIWNQRLFSRSVWLSTLWSERFFLTICAVLNLFKMSLWIFMQVILHPVLIMHLCTHIRTHTYRQKYTVYCIDS